MYSNIHTWLQQNNWPHIDNQSDFLNRTLDVFHFQYAHNPIYRQFVDALGKDPNTVTHFQAIPFLPVSFFKTHQISTEKPKTDTLCFESSGTTGSVNSKHYVLHPDRYNQSFHYSFQQFYGAASDYIILGLLPSYLERNNASLVYMVDALIKESRQPQSGFYLDQTDQLARVLAASRSSGKKVLLLGVTFALLDFAAQYPMDLSHVTVMETGGMKGRKAEWTRTQVHEFLKETWQLKQVHSEYGMTELLSQAYARKDGIFHCPDHMRILVRDVNDPFDIANAGSGLINIIDLANIYSCSFIATDDIGQLARDGSFEVLGRADHSALRGCSLMVL